MFNNNCSWIIIILLLVCFCGNGFGGIGCNNGCNNGCGCNNNDCCC